MAGPWGKSAGRERLQWALAPLEGVGPLEFGMSHNDAALAVGDSMVAGRTHGRPDPIERAEFWLPGARPLITASMISTYYDAHGALSAVAVNARNGPQVTLGGICLAHRVPSELEDDFIKFLDAFDETICYNQRGDPSSRMLGVVLRTQRVDDVVLSRPVFVSRDWADRCGDVSEGPIPQAEWRIFS